MVTTGALIDQVKFLPSRNSLARPPIQQGSAVEISDSQPAEGITWYQITYENGETTGWIPAEYVTPDSNCPSSG